jgi:hypothetical protein
LYGFGVSIHLIKTMYPEKRKLLKGRRLEHFEGALPNVDHVAFVCGDINTVERQLVEHNVFYKRVSGLPRKTVEHQWSRMGLIHDPVKHGAEAAGNGSFGCLLQFDSEHMGIHQIFLFDPGEFEPARSVARVEYVMPPVAAPTSSM